MFRESVWTAVLAALSAPAWAQRTDANAVTEAQDAFGSSIGNESIGLYSSSEVRGFSPLAAGNVRLEGLYFDRQAWLQSRLIEGSTVHVGLSALGYPFPAPTGIVDYRLNKAEGRRVTSIAAAVDSYGAASLEIDTKQPLRGEALGLAAGASYANEEYYDGSNARFFHAALILHWRPSDQFEFMPFVAVTRGEDEEAVPVVVTGGPWLPPRIARRRLFDQSWADIETRGLTYGALARADFGGHWQLAAGLFRSILRHPETYSEVFVDTQPDGRTRELLIADPPQSNASTSGELRLSRSVTGDARAHTIHASLRAVNRESLYGGSAEPLDLGPRQLGELVAVARPSAFAFGERTRDQVRQWTMGLAYEGRWRNVGEISLGFQRAHYEKQVEQPDLPRVITRDEPWLLSATVAAYLSDRVAAYAGYTRGLEESGLAPSNAANRNQALPALRTQQMDAGLRWNLREDLKLVAGYFDVRKPYFTLDEANVFTELGQVQHRGFELSLNGSPLPGWNVVAGAVLMRPRVSGEAVELGRVGRRPVGESAQQLRTYIEYRPPAVSRWSFDVALSHDGSQVASSDGQARLPASTLMDIGARYRLKFGGAPATLRLQVLNVADRFTWSVWSSNAYGMTDGRRISATLFVDL
ncbi:MAG: TonB-dependent receptor [Steroidobacteraceae bacterium]